MVTSDIGSATSITRVVRRSAGADHLDRVERDDPTDSSTPLLDREDSVARRLVLRFVGERVDRHPAAVVSGFGSHDVTHPQLTEPAGQLRVAPLRGGGRDDEPAENRGPERDERDVDERRGDPGADQSEAEHLTGPGRGDVGPQLIAVAHPQQRGEDPSAVQRRGGNEVEHREHDVDECEPGQRGDDERGDDTARGARDRQQQESRAERRRWSRDPRRRPGAPPRPTAWDRRAARRHRGATR